MIKRYELIEILYIGRHKNVPLKNKKVVKEEIKECLTLKRKIIALKRRIYMAYMNGDHWNTLEDVTTVHRKR